MSASGSTFTPSSTLPWLCNTVRFKVQSDRPLFIGIARTDDLDRYLAGVEHDEVSELTYWPFDVEYDHADGQAPRRTPAAESF